MDPASLGLLERYFGLSLAGEKEWLDSLETVELPGGDWLFRQGEPGDSLYFLIRGRLQVLRVADEADAGQGATLLGEVVAGESVGEVGLLTGHGRSAGVRAIRDSLLVRVDRAAFEQMAGRNPALILKLAASVADRLRQNIASRAEGSRPLKTIALMALDRSLRIDSFCRALVDGLAGVGRALDVHREGLAAVGAPGGSLDAMQALDEPLQHWLSEQESGCRFLIYHLDQSATPWSRFCLRQADIVLMVGESGSDPARRAWEAQLAGDGELQGGSHQALVLLQPEAAQPIRGTMAWLEPRRVDFHLHVRADRPDDLQRVVRIISGRATGLVLGAGAARGFAHLGVYRAMVEAGIPVDWVGGSSIGAIMAAAVAHDWTPAHAIAVARSAFVEGKPFSDYTFPMVSLLSGSRMTKLLQLHLEGELEDLPIPFFCVSSNLSTGALSIHERGPIWKAARASASLPGVLPPVVHEGQLTVDGAVLNSLPVDIMQGKLVGRVIAVDLTTRKAYQIDYDEVPSVWAMIFAKLTFRSSKVRLPGLATLMLKSTEIGTMARVRELGARADLLLRPEVYRFSMMNVKAFDRLIEAGYANARDELAKWTQARATPEGD
ncbi:MAG: patatin-like phospholipase family protein [Arenimonas sp.]|nr:patatin-like phospholipase family protein [Arenimonas sp.]